MVPLQSCIRRGWGGGVYITALKGISIRIVNQCLLRKSRLTPVFMTRGDSSHARVTSHPPPSTVSQLKDTGRRLTVQQASH